MRALIWWGVLALMAPCTIGQESEKTGQDPVSAYNHRTYEGIKAIVLRSAELVPAESYEYRPTEELRSFGEIVAHTANAQSMFCSIVLEDQERGPTVAETASKDALIEALHEVFSYCDRAYDAMDATTSSQMVTLMGRETPKLGALATNNLHTIEHYGNMVTYMRMLGIVPPTSDPDFMKNLM